MGRWALTGCWALTDCWALTGRWALTGWAASGRRRAAPSPLFQLADGPFERIEQTGDLAGRQEDTRADGRLGEKICEEIEPELGRAVPDHDAVGIGPAERFVGHLQVVIDLLRRRPALIRGGRLNRRRRRFAEAAPIDRQIFLQRVDELRHHRVGNHDSCGDPMRAADRLQKIDDVLGRPGHHDHAGAEATVGDVVRDACPNRRVTLFRCGRSGGGRSGGGR